MKRLFSSKRRIAAVGVAIAVVGAGAGAADAYFTSTGSGTGAASVGAPSTWQVTVDSPTLTGDTAGLTPQPTSCRPASTAFDGNAGTCSVYETYAYHVKNTNSGNQLLSHVAISIANSDGSAWTSVAGCSASDFSVDGAAPGTAVDDTTHNGDLTGGTTQDGVITVTMIDDGASQNACQGASVPLLVAAS